MADDFVHTVFKGGQWLNELEGGAEFGGRHSTKEARSRPVARTLNRKRPSMSFMTKTARSVSGIRMGTIPPPAKADRDVDCHRTRGARTARSNVSSAHR
jgi:hypothetical protein